MNNWMFIAITLRSVQIPLHPTAGNRRKGFTLLELLIAIAILAFALSALLGHQGIAIQASDYSNRVSQASFLMESKVQDIKHKMLSDSIDVFDNCDEGDFRDEGFKQGRNGYRWKVCAFKIEIQEGSTELLTERFMSLMAGGSMGEGMGNGIGTGGLGSSNGSSGMNMMDKAMGQIAMATGMIPQFLQQLEDKIRKIKIEVSWQDQTQKRKIMIERFVTTLGVSEGPTEKDDLANENQTELEDDLINNGMPPPSIK
jgi:general secretion pathway protein I